MLKSCKNWQVKKYRTYFLVSLSISQHSRLNLFLRTSNKVDMKSDEVVSGHMRSYEVMVTILI